jgi:DNA-binding IclR family transcriptional regulator
MQAGLRGRIHTPARTSVGRVGGASAITVRDASNDDGGFSLVCHLISMLKGKTEFKATHSLFAIPNLVLYIKQMPKSSNAGFNPLDRYKVPILDRTLDLLELLSNHPEGMTLTTMTDALKMPKNSVFRIATTLTLRGYVEREEVMKIYRVSRKLLSLGHAAVGGERLIHAAAPILTALRDATGETALLGTLAGNHGVVLDQVPSSHPVKVVVEIGHAFTLHTAAPAKAMLAHWSTEAQKAIVKQMKFTKHTRYTITSATAFLAELNKIQALGYALDRGEESETFACVAAPVFDHRRHPVASIWISGPSDRVTPGSLDKLGHKVKHFAHQLSQRLGYPG